MNLLHDEFIEGPDGSINGMLRELVKGLRYNRSFSSADEFRKAMPGLHEIESEIQRSRMDVGQPKRNYIQEIMEELDREQDDEMNIVDDLKRATRAMIRKLFNEEFNFEDLVYFVSKAEHYHWVHFSGYGDGREVDGRLLIIRKVFRGICGRYGYVFVDVSG